MGDESVVPPAVYLSSKMIVNPVYPGGEEWVDDYGKVYVHTHTRIACRGTPCALHNPSGHHMVNWPRRIINWPKPVVVRRCEHGAEHPDPDSIFWWKRIDADAVVAHDCDGCCIGAG